MIIVDHDTLAVFHMNVAGGNLLGAVRRQGDKLRVIVRIRMTVDDKVWDSKDKKSWYEIETQGDPAEAIAKLRFIFQMAPLKMGRITEIFQDETGPQGMMEKIGQIEGMNQMTVPAKGNLH